MPRAQRRAGSPALIVDDLDALAPQQANGRRFRPSTTPSHAAGLLEGLRRGRLARGVRRALTQIGTVCARLGSRSVRRAPAADRRVARRGADPLDEASRVNRYLIAPISTRLVWEVEARMTALHDAARKFKTCPNGSMEC
jgi:hypothetical protein